MGRRTAYNRYGLQDRRAVAGVLRRVCERVGSQRKAAAALGLDRTTFGDLLARKKPELDASSFHRLAHSLARVFKGDTAAIIALRQALDAAVRRPLLPSTPRAPATVIAFAARQKGKAGKIAESRNAASSAKRGLRQKPLELSPNMWVEIAPEAREVALLSGALVTTDPQGRTFALSLRPT
jgi:hypothetical protein